MKCSNYFLLKQYMEMKSKSPSSKSPSSKSSSSKSSSSKSRSSKSPSSKSPSSKSPSSKSPSSNNTSSYSRRNIFERFGDSSAHIVQKLIDDDIAETLLNNDAGKFKLNKKELDYILQQLINKNTTTKKYEMVMKELQNFLGFQPNEAQYKRILYIFKFCMKNRKFSFEIDMLLEVMNEKLFNFFAKIIVDKEITNQKDYDQTLSDIFNFIQHNYYDYEGEEYDTWLIRFLEYFAKHRKFNLKHFKKLSSSILNYYGNYDYEGVVKNNNMAVFVEKIIKKENIDVTETKQNIKQIYKILLNIYHEIFDTILFLIYEEDMKIELHYRQTSELIVLMDLLFKRINEIIIMFDTNDFQDKAIKDALVLDIESLDANPKWRSSGKYDGMSPPRTKIRRIILGDNDTLTILQKHNVHSNVQYVLDDFEIVN